MGMSDPHPGTDRAGSENQTSRTSKTGPHTGAGVELAAELGAYALDLCELVIPGHSAVMLFRDAEDAPTDGEEDLHARGRSLLDLTAEAGTPGASCEKSTRSHSMLYKINPLNVRTSME